MWSDGGSSSQDRSANVGFSSIGGICTQNRYSIIEETGGFRTVNVVAHELGHNLGSFHDGVTTDPFAVNCDQTQNYIMTPGIGVYKTNLLNMFKFSSCSVAAFKNTLLSGT